MQNLSLTPVMAGDPAVEIAAHPAWIRLKSAVEELRPSRPRTARSTSAAVAPHRTADARWPYHRRGVRELSPPSRTTPRTTRRCSPTCAAGPPTASATPDFLDSLLAFRPETSAWTACATSSSSRCTPRTATRTATSRPCCCACSGRTGWPSSRRTRYDNPMLPADLLRGLHRRLRHQLGRAVSRDRRRSARRPSAFTWGAIFCDREAARFRAVTTAAAEATPPRAARGRRPADRGPGRSPRDLRRLGPGPRPHAQPRRPALRPLHDQAADAVLDVLPRGAALRPDRLQGGGPARRPRAYEQGRDVQYAILFDRMFRFPVSGDRVRNYDGLGGQLLFAYLHKHDALRWTRQPAERSTGTGSPPSPTRCAARSRRSTATASTGPRPRTGSPRTSWSPSYLTPHPASTWAQGRRRPAARRAPRRQAAEQGPVRRRAAGRVPAQHVLRGPRQEAARRHRLHPRHHRRRDPEVAA